ncbi:MAG: response regulator [Planctomycetes bacterium]|nr:response regulator [Planctomycetota bacterium]
MADEQRRSARLRAASRSRTWLLAGGVSLVCVVATVGAFLTLASEEDRSARARFARRVEAVRASIEQKLELEATALRAAAGYVAGSEHVTREEWATFVERQHLSRTQPGLRTFAFVARVPRDALDAFVARMRAEGSPDFRVTPASPTPAEGDAMVVAYAEPATSDRSLVGVDLSTVEGTRNALVRASRSTSLQVSGPHPGGEGEPGDRTVAMALATATESPRAPQAAGSAGWVVALIQLRSFVEEQTAAAVREGLDVEVFAGEVATPAALLLDTDRHLRGADDATWQRRYEGRAHDVTRRLHAADTTWTLRVSATSEWGDPDRPVQARWVVLALGLAASGLVLATVVALSRTRRLAERLAERATGHLARQARELQEARDAAMAVVRAKSDFYAAVSHEVRTPLHGILGMSRLLIEADLPVEQAEQARAVDASARALLAILNDVLDVSRIEAGKLVLEAAPFDLRTACEDVLDLLVGQAAAKGVELVLRWRRDVPTTFVGDGLRVKQVLANLAGNAVKYTDRGSVLVDVAAPVLEPRRAELLVRVEDTGVGIPPDKLPLLFRRFSQVDTSPTRREGGTGLGLRITRLLVEHMGGTIEVESHPGRGTVFSVRLRLARPPEPTVPPSARRPKGPLLVVDRSSVARSAVRESAEALGCEVIEARSETEALEALARAAAEGRPVGATVLGTDGDGSPFVAAVRGVPATAATPLLLTSPPASASVADAARAAGFDGWLSKPLRGRDLRAALDRLADGRVAGAPFLTRAVLAAGRRGTSPSTAPLGSHRDVLLVEDHEVNVLLARRMLEVLGCGVTVARDGHEAVARSAERAFDLVLMDCRMPGMDGYEATREIRTRDAGGRRVPIVAMTADATEADRQRCLDAGMDDFLAKPFDLDALRRMILRWSPAARPASPPPPPPPPA